MKAIIIATMTIATLVGCVTMADDAVKQGLDKKIEALDKKYAELKKSYLVKAIEEYDKLKLEVMKKGDLAAAVEYKNKIDALAESVRLLEESGKKPEQPPVAKKEEATKEEVPVVDDGNDVTKVGTWDRPMGGLLTSDPKGETVLSGMGRGPDKEALAIFDKELGQTYFVKGEIKVTGRFGGFAFQYDNATGSHYSTYSTESYTSSCQHINSGSRHLYAKLENLHWPRDKWIKFEISYKQGKLKIKLDGREQSMIISTRTKAGRWGLVQYESTVRVRNLKIVDGGDR